MLLADGWEHLQHHQKRGNDEGFGLKLKNINSRRQLLRLGPPVSLRHRGIAMHLGTAFAIRVRDLLQLGIYFRTPSDIPNLTCFPAQGSLEYLNVFGFAALVGFNWETLTMPRVWRKNAEICYFAKAEDWLELCLHLRVDPGPEPSGEMR